MNRQMTPEEVARLIESQQVELKKSLSLQKEGCEALCGMLNADAARGVVLFGVAPDGSIVGVEPGDLDKAQNSLAQHVRENFDPPLPVSIEVVQCGDKNLIAMQAERPKNTVLYEYDGRAFIREGSSRRRLTVAEKAGLSSRRRRDTHQGPWRCDRCGSVAGMISGIVVTERGIEKSYECGCGGEYWPAT